MPCTDETEPQEINVLSHIKELIFTHPHAIFYKQNPVSDLILNGSRSYLYMAMVFKSHVRYL